MRGTPLALGMHTPTVTGRCWKILFRVWKLSDQDLWLVQVTQDSERTLGVNILYLNSSFIAPTVNICFAK